MSLCNLCPRKCNVNRDVNPGVCGAKNTIVIRKVMLHQYEEPILTASNEKGSGAIFFAGCNLQCVYCQNYDVSHSMKGKKISTQELANIFKDLEEKGAGNIDLITPTHFTEQIIEALKIYKPNIPVIWNSGGYESPESISQLKNLVDIFLVDFKYSNNLSAIKYSKAPYYVENATASLVEMKKQQPNNVFNNGKLVKGIIVRHLVLPSLAKESLPILDSIKSILGEDAIVSIMSQYVPMGKACEYSEINRPINNLEYKLVVNHALKIGLKNAFTQELNSANIKYTPTFNNNIFDF